MLLSQAFIITKDLKHGVTSLSSFCNRMQAKAHLKIVLHKLLYITLVVWNWVNDLTFLILFIYHFKLIWYFHLRVIVEISFGKKEKTFWRNWTGEVLTKCKYITSRNLSMVLMYTVLIGNILHTYYIFTIT